MKGAGGVRSLLCRGGAWPRPPCRKARLCGVPSWPATMGLRQRRVPKKQKAPIEVPDLVGTDSGRLSLAYKKASSAEPGRTFLRS